MDVRRTLPGGCCLAGWFTTGWLLLGQSTSAGEWPQFRGPTHDGISTDRMTRQWTGGVTNPLWRASFTNGLGSLVVAGGRVFTQVKRTLGGLPVEVCLALDATTGTELWSRVVDDALYPQTGVGPDDGPRSTPAVKGGAVYVLGSYLKLLRLNATNGAVMWSNNLSALYGGVAIPWQNAASPLLEGGLIFVNANASPQRLMALYAADGSLAWRSQDAAMTHATPTLATIQGVRHLIFATQSGLVSVDPASGERLWSFPYPFAYGTSLAPSPVVYEDMVFISGAQIYNMGSVVARVGLMDGTWTATQLWANTTLSSTLASHWMTPVCHEGFLYGQFGVQSFDSTSAQLKCVDMRTGTVKWSTNNFGRAGTLLVDNHLVVVTEQGQLVLVKPRTNAYTELGRFTAITNFSSANRCWNMPAVANGRAYVRSTAQGACFDLSMPDLKLDPPRLLASSTLRLTVRTVDGTPLDTNRLAALEVRGSTQVTAAATQWTRLTNAARPVNGAARIDNVDATPPQQFFRVKEPE
jgi:outer membrane protein assembly factor BamB